MSLSFLPFGAARYRLSDWPMSIHFWRRLAHSISHCGSISNAVRNTSLTSSGMRSISVSTPS